MGEQRITTARPWRVLDAYWSTKLDAYLIVAGGREKSYQNAIAEMHTSRADAELIVRAVNAHEELVDAAGRLLRFYDTYLGVSRLTEDSDEDRAADDLRRILKEEATPMDEDETDYYELTELYGKSEYIAHKAAPGLPTRVLTVCGKSLDDLLTPDQCEAGLHERKCVTCFP